MTIRRFTVVALTLALLLPSGATATRLPLASSSSPPASAPGPTEGCNYDTNLPVKQVADDLLADRYHLGKFPVATLPHVLTWKEDPFNDVNWRERQHMLPLRHGPGVPAGARRRKRRYLDRAFELVRSWLDLNPVVCAALAIFLERSRDRMAHHHPRVHGSHRAPQGVAGRRHRDPRRTPGGSSPTTAARATTA